MKATEITVERTFYLGASGTDRKFHESASFRISWTLENETLEEAEEKALAKLYEMAERERKRRYGYLKHLTEEYRREQKEKANKALPVPESEQFIRAMRGDW